MTGKNSTSQAYSRYVAALERTALDSTAWSDACDHLAELVDAKGAVLIAEDYARHRLSTPHSSSLSEAFDHAVNSGWNRHDIRHKAWKANLRKGFVRDQDVISPELVRKHAFYAEFLLSHGLLWCGTALFTIDGSIWGAAVHAGADREPFSDDDMETLLQLRRPLVTAAKRASVLGEQRLALLEDTFSAASRGLAILDWSGSILAASPRGEALLKTGNLVRRGELAHDDPRFASRLRDLADFAIKLEPGAQAPVPPPVLIPAGDESIISVDAIPLPRDFQCFIANAAAMLTMHRVDPAERSLDQILTHGYRLTPREAELTLHLMDGRPLNEAATRMNISVETARHHLKSIFAKTGTNRQSELILRVTRPQEEVSRGFRAHQSRPD